MSKRGVRSEGGKEGRREGVRKRERGSKGSCFECNCFSFSLFLYLSLTHAHVRTTHTHTHTHTGKALRKVEKKDESNKPKSYGQDVASILSRR